MTKEQETVFQFVFLYGQVVGMRDAYQDCLERLESLENKSKAELLSTLGRELEGGIEKFKSTINRLETTYPYSEIAKALKQLT